MGGAAEDKSEGQRIFDRSFLDEVLNPDWVRGESFAGASGFSIDSRTLREGDIFVALRTAKRDGHEFLGTARDRGAAAALVSDPDPDIAIPQIVVADPLSGLQFLGAAWRKRWGGRVIAVTGSCGKTSTKEMLGLLFGEEETFVTPGNLNNYLGIPLCELMLRPHHRRAILEAGINEVGEMEKLAAMLTPEIAVVTTVGPAHLEKLGSVEGVAREKAVLPAHASESVFFGPACAAFDAFTGSDRVEAHWLLSESQADKRVGHLWRYSASPVEGGCEVSLGDGEKIRFPAPETTAGMIENVCLAIMVARDEGVTEDQILERLPEWRPSRQRGEILEIAGRTVYADCYNANPASVADAIHYFHRRFPDPPRVWVIGGMGELGEDSSSWHRKLAKDLPILSGDRVFLVGGLTVEMIPVLREKVSEPEDVCFDESVDAVLERVAETEGVLFLKGSRKYKLEKILDSLAAHNR
ncbi:MAG: UDP-N-acetylmuramoyl-tripeptide--D-alanyl-D-alanine ligase [Puniceicoccales bacterium]